MLNLAFIGFLSLFLECSKVPFNTSALDADVTPFFLIPERDLSLVFPFSQDWEKGLGDEG
jgi:hypothetical protein